MLDRLNHFDITLNYTAGKEIEFTNFISQNPTENAEPEENYEEKFVINAIGRLATVNGFLDGFSTNQKPRYGQDGKHACYAHADWYAPLQNKQLPFQFDTDC